MDGNNYTIEETMTPKEKQEIKSDIDKLSKQVEVMIQDLDAVSD